MSKGVISSAWAKLTRLCAAYACSFDSPAAGGLVSIVGDDSDFSSACLRGDDLLAKGEASRRGEYARSVPNVGTPLLEAALSSGAELCRVAGPWRVPATSSRLAPKTTTPSAVGLIVALPLLMDATEVRGVTGDALFTLRVLCGGSTVTLFALIITWPLLAGRGDMLLRLRVLRSGSTMEPRGLP
mmetsp:Transcript_86335/g.158173  ORF Transcript_86335/g.158173 Transcript_86335/m.158173 type:complete len:185 (+) Transcript_86335:883-1437(+)